MFEKMADLACLVSCLIKMPYRKRCRATTEKLKKSNDMIVHILHESKK